MSRNRASFAAKVAGDQISRLADGAPRKSSEVASLVFKPSSPKIEEPLTTRARGGVVYVVAKRTFDVVGSAVLMVVAFPIVMLAAAAIWIDSAGSPFFIQTRLGQNGRPFKIIKLRGMYQDARLRFPEYYDYSKRTDLNFFFHHEVDPRVTRAGKFLRTTSIDELPNLWNVIRGDMSLVGPRPEIPEVLDLYGNLKSEYLSVKPGVTCKSKCAGRDKLTKRETIEIDLQYVRSRSFWLDLKIVWRTFLLVILRRDVF